MSKGKVELSSFSIDLDERQVYKYSVEQNNGTTSVEQELTICGVVGLFHSNWEATIKLDDFPSQPTQYEAAIKLADWLERLAAAIRIGEYQSIPSAEFIDISEETQ